MCYDEEKKMNSKTAIATSCWFAIAFISAVYMIVFGDKLADILLGVFLPIGLLVAVAVAVTVWVTSSSPQEKT
jgi:hypothetical protein